jgi:hypothetical protein
VVSELSSVYHQGQADIEKHAFRRCIEELQRGAQLEIKCIVILDTITLSTCFDDQIRDYHVCCEYTRLFPFRFDAFTRQIVGSDVSSRAQVHF